MERWDIQIEVLIPHDSRGEAPPRVHGIDIERVCNLFQDLLVGCRGSAGRVSGRWTSGHLRESGTQMCGRVVLRRAGEW